MTNKAVLFAATVALWLGGLVNDANAGACYESSIISPVPFMGNNDEIFKLADGTSWQVKFAYSYLYAYYPIVVICPDEGKLKINGMSINIVKR